MADDDGKKLGLKTAVARTHDAAVSIMEGEQLALLPTDAAAGMIADQSAEGDAAQRRGPGRPPGSRNRRTEEWTDFILGNYRSPLLFLAETYTRPAAVLAAELNCKMQDAFKMQVAAAEALAPFVHQKQPVAVQVDASGIVTLVLEAGGIGQAAGQAGDDAIVIEHVEGGSDADPDGQEEEDGNA